MTIAVSGQLHHIIGIELTQVLKNDYYEYIRSLIKFPKPSSIWRLELKTTTQKNTYRHLLLQAS